MGSLLERYFQGEYEAVWKELRSHAAIEGPLLEEARAVCRETMSRVSQGVQRIAKRLNDRGWHPLYEGLHTKPQPSDARILQSIEEITEAPLPLAFRTFWEVVGGVNFVWNYEDSDPAPSCGLDLDLTEMDPLCVDSPEAASHQIPDLGEQQTQRDAAFEDPFQLDLAPDHYHKVDVSGGPPYGIGLPFLGIDPVFKNEQHRLPFVDYLRLCLRYGGFPGLERYDDREDVKKFVAEMTRGVPGF